MRILNYQPLSFILIVFLLCAGLFGCTEEKESTTRVISFSVYPEAVKLTQLGTVLNLNLVAENSDNQNITEQLDNVIWRSSDESIATVDQNGTVTAHAVGTVTIGVSIEGFESSSVVTVDESNKNIFGLARYEDRLYDENGFIPADNLPPYKGIRYATIDLLDGKGNVLESTATSAIGHFSFSPIIPDVYSIRILAQVNTAPAMNFEVRDFSEYLYAVTFSFTDDVASHQLDVLRFKSKPEVFNILDVMTASAEFSRDRLGVTPSGLTTYWQTGNNNGTYYCTGADDFGCENGKGIYVLSERSSFIGSDDTDEYDDDVLMHEFGHYLMDNYAIDDSEGGCHRLTQNDSDLRLAWSEGWGTFLPSAIKSWIESNKPQLKSAQLITTYIDTIGGKPSITYDIANPFLPESDESSFYYASSEAAVAKVLWEVHNGFFSGMQKIWDVVDNYMPTSPRPTNLANFWDGLQASALYNSSDLPDLEIIFNERKVFYQDDTAEDDDSMETATSYIDGVTNKQTRHLYLLNQSLDVDYVSFDAIAGNSYEIKTLDLTNGIDTELSVLDSNGNVIQDNDDADPGVYYRFDSDCGLKRVFNDALSLASAVDFTPTQSGTYYVQVKYADKFAPQADFTGHYGSYKVSIIQK